jgi:diguanylate cyclase (GGDEF)-like protein
MRVAVVDPTREGQEAVERILSMRGDEFVAFAKANEALAGIEFDTKIDALITSADVEPFHGIELCQKARRLAGKQRAIYFLLVAPPGDLKTKIDALNFGADDVIEKPPAPEELLAKLRMAERMVTLQRSATMDHLSGVYNRGAFFGEATEACRKASPPSSLSVILLDIDCLKTINDNYGHDVGDEAIRAVANVAQHEGAFVGRLGGDEFSILLKDHNLTKASAVAAELQRRLAQVSLTTPEGAVGVTCSLGISELLSGDTIDDLIKRADLALYRAKSEGRNRAETTPPDPSTIQSTQLRVTRARFLPRPSQEVRERRNGLPPSDGLLARVCACVDLLVASGESEELAIARVAQRMTAAQVQPPKDVTSRNWPQLILAWKAAIRNGLATNEAVAEYKSVVAAIESIPQDDRVASVLDNELWNRRRIDLSRRLGG